MHAVRNDGGDMGNMRLYVPPSSFLLPLPEPFQYFLYFPRRPLHWSRHRTSQNKAELGKVRPGKAGWSVLRYSRLANRYLGG